MTTNERLASILACGLLLAFILSPMGTIAQQNVTRATLYNTANTAIATNTGTSSAAAFRIVTASDSPDVTVLGSTSDAAATVGGTGSLRAGQRLQTTQLDQIETAVESLRDVGINIKQVNEQEPIFSACLNSDTRTTIEVSEAAGTTTIQFVAPASLVRPYFCGGMLVIGGAGVVTLTAGTGATCGTSSQTQMTFRGSVANEYIFNAASDVSFWRGDNGDGLCYTRSASVSLDGYLTYVLVSEP